MQRSFTYKKILTGLLLVIGFGLYQSLSSIYLLFPPMLGVLFFYFVYALEKEDLPKLLLVIVLLLIFEAEKDFLLFSSLVYFTFIYRFILPRLRIMISCQICLKILLLNIAYLGYVLFSYVLAQVLWVEVPSVDWHIFYYMFLEFFLVLSI
ncbi:MAG: hypothetical protein COA44_08710 [Arcobacter sp.]|nr:MAG: hypothetical protein COA44_08710 [Arcobacter sp.]